MKLNIHKPTLDQQEPEEQRQTVLALAFGGGGFKSVADDAGVTAGLLGYLSMKDNTKEDSYTLESSGLYGDVDVLSTISGGSWFGALSIYSKKFKGLIDAIAKKGACPDRCSKKSIEELYNDGFSKLFETLTVPFQRRSEVEALEGFLKTDEEELKDDQFLLEAQQELKGLAEGLGDLNALGRLLFRNGLFKLFSWKDFVNVILQDISNDEGSNTIVDPKDFKEVDVTLGSKDVNEWAKSKIWAIITSIIYPDEPGKAIWHKGAFFKRNERCDKAKSKCSISNKSLKDRCLKFTRYINYQIDQSTRPEENGKQQQVIPARFSTVVGGTNGEKAPLPFGTEKFLKDVKVEYTWKNTDFYLPIRKPESSVGLMPKLTESENFDDTPVLGTAAASSAFAGGLASQCIPELFNIETNVWFSPKREGKAAFDEPATIAKNLWTEKKLFQSRPTKKTVENIADLGLYELFDGGFTDPFGISTALAAGATDIFTINSVADARGLKPGKIFSDTVTLHFSDFDDEKSLVQPEIANVFKETVTEYNNTLKSERPFCLGTQGENSLLSGLTFVTATVTTKENEYFGIEEGRKVKLYLVEPQSEKLSIGNDENFNNYGKYVQEIVEVMTDENNSDIMKDMVKALKKSTTTAIGSGNTQQKRTYADVVKGEL